jgi:hypothetical protein
MFARLRFIRDGFSASRCAIWGKGLDLRDGMNVRSGMLLTLLLGIDRSRKHPHNRMRIGAIVAIPEAGKKSFFRRSAALE